MTQGKVAANAGEMAERLTIFSNGSERPVMVSTSPSGSLIAFSPRLLVTKLPAGETLQLDMFGGAIRVVDLPRKKRHR